ncbi:Hypothetical protein NTJ_07613 [Nesidiocoris tenuis]|uniref:Uncharacterized protein n=1 Tax=Nesidiocoris tenuis TaxID=355587 RepID=A0ABN7AWG7_9HEMI|nr:Hypothetical protein NTJ_07613 [Nesidiocoris tenuis]
MSAGEPQGVESRRRPSPADNCRPTPSSPRLLFSQPVAADFRHRRPTSSPCRPSASPSFQVCLLGDSRKPVGENTGDFLLPKSPDDARGDDRGLENRVNGDGFSASDRTGLRIDGRTSANQCGYCVLN